MSQRRVAGMTTAVAWLLLVPTVSTQAAESLKVTNNTHRPMEFWIWPYRIHRWKRPPERFAPKESKQVHFNIGEDYFLLLRDDLHRETPLGRHNISRVLSANPHYQLAISEVVQTRMVYEVTHVWCPRCRRWHKKVVSRVEPGHVRYIAEWLDRRARTPPLPHRFRPSINQGQ